MPSDASFHESEPREKLPPAGMRMVSVTLDFYIPNEVDADWFGEEFLLRVEAMPDVRTMDDGTSIIRDNACG